MVAGGDQITSNYLQTQSGSANRGYLILVNLTLNSSTKDDSGMDETPKTSDLTLDDRKHDFLSASDIEQCEGSSTRGRSSSVSPSLRSFRSGTTEVYTEPISAAVSKKRKFKKLTSTVDYKLSFWDYVRGLNFFDKKARTVRVAVEVTDDGDDTDSDEYEIERESPFIQNVFVLSNKKDWQGHYVPKQARCIIDSGNHQGNIVSREFLVNQLNFPESAFRGKELRKFEKEGASITGHTLTPDGAIHLDWYHAKSTQRYRNMRFLVSSNPQCELIIGASSIEKHGILTPPNLLNQVVDFNDWKTDRTYQKHAADLARVKNELDTLEEDLKDAVKEKKNHKINGLQTKIAWKKKEITVADLVLKHYVATVKLKEDSTNAEKKEEVEKLAAELRTAKQQLPQQPPRNIPKVTITDLNGQQRTSTGFSIRSRPHARSR
ncbi:hypothetical protein EG329_007311 [Mollisiaceae sp. DMI_Dod_QoI]|nr:hypothetical protein EG329_007311 [Helotiales sp. DMI_Dod_QoI]